MSRKEGINRRKARKFKQQERDYWAKRAEQIADAYLFHGTEAKLAAQQQQPVKH